MTEPLSSHAFQWLHEPLVALPRGWEDRPAVGDARGELDYRGLATRVAGLRGKLQAEGVSHGDRVVIALPRSVGAVAVTLAVLSAGAVVVPVDARSPRRRLTHLLADTGATLFVLTPALRMQLESDLQDGGMDALSTSWLEIDALGEGGGLEAYATGEAQAWVAEEPAITADDPALILFTSGSTGQPKGVVLSHRNVRSFVDWAIAAIGFGPGDRFFSHAPFHFDLSTLDLFAPLSLGAYVHLPDDKILRFPASVARLLETQRITVWYSVPTALRLLVEHGGLERRDLSALKRVLFAGEVYPIEALRTLIATLPGREFWNLYGPTETNVCTAHRLEGAPAAGASAIPIGAACAHYAVSVREPGSERRLSVGQVGEICVQGPGVFHGYWQAPEATEAVRVAGMADSYRTGDFGWLDEEGNFWFAGRRDDQVKLRGHRVELREVESQLEAHPAVLQAAVCAVRNAADVDFLIGFVLVDPGREGDEIEPEALRRHLAERLPDYAVPDQLVPRQAFPVTSTGKTDRQALRDEAEKRVST